MDQGALVTEEKDAGMDLIARMGKTWPVQVAFWLKPAERGRWSLYLAAKGLGDANIDQGYREVLRLIGEMRTPYLDPFQVKLITIDNPLARAVMEVRQSYPGELGINYQGTSLSAMCIDSAYLYALPGTASARQG